MAKNDVQSPASLKKIARAQQGTTRASLLGVSDGLVTNVSLILGVAGAGAAGSIVRLAGIASLIAGAFSMALGEYISMRGQIELLEGVLKAEQAEFEANPESVHGTLEKVLITDGVSKATAHTAAKEVAKNSQKALALYARGYLGINSSELGSAWGAAISSFITFSLGALVPLIPWFFKSNSATAPISIILAVLAALGIGGYMGVITGGNVLRNALRQLLVVIIAAAATFLIGHLFHATIT